MLCGSHRVSNIWLFPRKVENLPNDFTLWKSLCAKYSGFQKSLGYAKLLPSSPISQALLLPSSVEGKLPSGSRQPSPWQFLSHSNVPFLIQNTFQSPSSLWQLHIPKALFVYQLLLKTGSYKLNWQISAPSCSRREGFGGKMPSRKNAQGANMRMKLYCRECALLC